MVSILLDIPLLQRFYREMRKTLTPFETKSRLL